MTTENRDADWVNERLTSIENLKDDPECAHAAEDVLYIEVLTAIRDGFCDDARALAGTALTSQNIRFPRWYA